MSDSSERRVRRRVLVGPGYSLAFRVGEREFQGVSITNLSEDGCFAVVPTLDQACFSAGTRLQSLRLEHPDLPDRPFSGEVRYILGEEGDASDFVGLGIHFLDLDPGIREALKTHLAGLP